MAEKILLINPSRRPTKRGSKMARRKTVVRRKPTRVARKRRAPAKRKIATTRSRISRPTGPRRRRISVARRRPSLARRRRSPARRVRRNPALRKSTVEKFAHSVLIPSAIGAAGAIGLDALLPKVPLPAILTTGPARHITKGLAAVLMGMGLGKVSGNKKLGDQATLGMFTVALHGMMSEVVQTNFPSIQLGYYSPGMPMGEGSPRGTWGMGEYVGGADGQPNFPNQFGSSGPQNQPVVRAQECPPNEVGLYVAGQMR